MTTFNSGRIKLVGLAILIFSLIIVVRLYSLQIIDSEAYTNKANRQYINRGQNVFDRGAIFFSPRKGEPVSAATLATGFTVAIDPKQIEYPEDVYNALSGILPMNIGGSEEGAEEMIDEGLLAILSNPKGPYKEIARRVDEKTRDRIEALNFPGVIVTTERWRDYPASSTASNVLGFVAFGDDGKTIEGRYGLEKYYDDVLARDNSDLYVNFFAQIFSNINDTIFKGESSQGDIITTIEPSVQIELERTLSGVERKWSSDMTGGIVMNPYTGEIYAMAVSPTFNPNNFSKVKNSSVFGNPIVDRVYEMGSIVKPLAMAAALDAGVVTAKTTYDDKGSISLSGYKISNFDGRARGVTDMQKVLSESLNVGMAFITQKLGNDKLTEYFKNLGFGKETGIDLPGEVYGLVSNLDSPRDLEHVTASFGQGIALTPIATVRALSALGNGGFLPEPHIVKKIEYTSGFSKTIAYNNSYNDSDSKVFKPETSEEITRMLVRVVDEALLGGTVKMPKYSIAAKTGTAQMAQESGRGYYTDRYLHSFFGYFPAYKPRFIVFLYTLYPKGATYASHTLTQPFIDLTKFLINYYEVPPDR